MKLTYLTHCQDCQITEENHKHKPEVVKRIMAENFARQFKNKQAYKRYPLFVKGLDK